MTMKVWLPLTLRELVREVASDVRITWLVVASATISSRYSAEEPMKPKDPNESVDEQQCPTESNNDLVDKKIERKRKREGCSAGNTCKKSKVS